MPNPDLKAVVQRMIDAGESEENIATVIKSESADIHVPSTAIGLGTAAASAPLMQRMALEAATNPNVPRIFANAGRISGGVVPAVAGISRAASGDMMGAAYGLTAAAGGSWAGGRTGWFTGKLAQKLAMPIAKVADILAPYAQTLSTVSGAQGVLDVAQMAEPKRQDIGALGISIGTPRTPAEKDAHPALVNSIVSRLEDLVREYMSKGASKNDALNSALSSLTSSPR